MKRMPWAILAMFGFVFAWMAVAVILADRIGPMHWALQGLYFLVAGFVWVFPVRWLMLWGAGKR